MSLEVRYVDSHSFIYSPYLKCMSGPRILDYRDAGLLGPDIVFSHCNELWDHPDPDDEMWTVMKNNGCAVASTPVDELGMGHGLPVAFEAVERGVKCGLGAVRIQRDNCKRN